MMNPDSLIYLDYSATTPVAPQVVEAMLPYFTEKFGNAASRNHAFGWVAEEAVENARVHIADLVGASPKEIIFTSGATESNNLALLGVAEMYGRKGKHIITCVTEHKAVLDPAYYLETKGFDITFLPVNEYGAIDILQLKNVIREDTILISLMAVNNEIGNIHPLKEIGTLAHECGIVFHTDATQAVGKMPMDVNEMNIDLLSMSGHKIYGPKGSGALYVRRKNPRVRVSPVQHGGGHERGMRSGTLNVAGIVGLGEACRIAKERMEEDSAKVLRLRKKLLEGISEKVDHIQINGDPENFLPNILNISFNYIEGESLMMGIDKIAVSSGSACTSASLEPSYVLRAMGVGDEAAHSSIRFSIGRFTTDEEIEMALQQIVKVVQKLREMSPLYEMVKEGIDLNTIEWTAH